VGGYPGGFVPTRTVESRVKTNFNSKFILGFMPMDFQRKVELGLKLASIVMEKTVETQLKTKRQ
jgi:hypothetical protein